MDLVVLLDFICRGIGRLDLLVLVELFRDFGFFRGGEFDIGFLVL